MHLPLHTLLLPVLLPLLPHAHPSPPHPLAARQLTCNTTPSPHLQHADCLRAVADMPVSEPGIDYHPADLSALTLLRSSGPLGSANRLPRSFVAGTCRVNVQLVNGVGVVRMLWIHVRERARNVVALCVDDQVPRGGSSTFEALSRLGAVKVMVEEVVPPVGAGG